MFKGLSCHPAILPSYGGMMVPGGRLWVVDGWVADQSAQQASNPGTTRGEDVGHSFIGPGSGATAPRDKRQREGQPCRLGALIMHLSTALSSWSRRFNQAGLIQLGSTHRPVGFERGWKVRLTTSGGREGEKQKGVATPNSVVRRAAADWLP